MDWQMNIDTDQWPHSSHQSHRDWQMNINTDQWPHSSHQSHRDREMNINTDQWPHSPHQLHKDWQMNINTDQWPHSPHWSHRNWHMKINTDQWPHSSHQSGAPSSRQNDNHWHTNPLASSSGGRLGTRGRVRVMSIMMYDLASAYCCPSTLTGAWPSTSEPVSDLSVVDACHNAGTHVTVFHCLSMWHAPSHCTHHFLKHLVTSSHP